MSRPRVAILGSRGYPSFYGGFETLVRHLAPYLADENWDVSVYGRASRPDDSDEHRDPRIVSVRTPGVESKSLSTLSYGLTSAGHTAIKHPDVALVLNVANGYWLPLLRGRGIPTLVNVDGIEWEREKWGYAARQIFHTGAKLTARWANHLIFDAEALKERWQNEFARGGTVIRYGGTTHPPIPLPLSTHLEHRRYVLLVARLVPENSIEPFLTAASELAHTTDVVIVGSSGYAGGLDSRVDDMSRQNPRIHWLGHLTDDNHLAALWQHAGAYFHGHSVGGTNPALVQAMASGAPTVARDTVYNRETLGDAGIYAKPDSASIAQAIRSLLSDNQLQERLANAARVRAAASFSWPDICQSYHQLLTHARRGSK